jgi:hypothetical protein
MSANGISELATKELRQVAKLDLAALKRQGNVLNSDGTVYSTPLGSAQFNGVDQYFSGTGNSGLTLDGDFTVEMWFKGGAQPNVFPTLLAQNGSWSGNTSQCYICVSHQSAANVISLHNDVLGGAFLIGTAIVTDDTWHHVAIVRSGGNITLYVDGVIDGTYSSSFTVDYTNFAIGSNPSDGGASIQQLAYQGLITNLRIVKGQALYTNNFTPSTSTLTAVAGTQLLLLNGTTEFVDGSSNQFTITNSGSVTLSTTTPTLTISAPFYRARATYDITQLPTQYDDNDVVDNENTGGLVAGRPWTT